MKTPRPPFRSLDVAVPALTGDAMKATLLSPKASRYFDAWRLYPAKPPATLWEKAVSVGSFLRFLQNPGLVELTPAERRSLELAYYEAKGRLEPLIKAVLDVVDDENDESPRVEGKLWQKVLPEMWCLDDSVFEEGCLWMDAIAPLMALRDALHSVEVLLGIPFEPEEERRRLAHWLPIPPDDPNEPIPDEDGVFLVGHFSWMAWVRDFAPEGAWWKEPLTYIKKGSPVDRAVIKALSGKEMTPDEVRLCVSLLKGGA